MAFGGTSSGRILLEGSAFESGGRQTSPEQKLETSFMSSHAPSIAPTSSRTCRSQRVHHRCVEGLSRKSGQWTAPGHICPRYGFPSAPSRKIPPSAVASSKGE